MLSKSRFATAALVAGLIGFQPAFAQQPEAELKKAQEQLEKLLKELKDRETKKPDAPKPPVPPTPPTAPAKPMVAWTHLQPGGDLAVLKSLLGSKDPKVAAMAKQLLEHLNKSSPQPSKPLELHLELAKPAVDGNGGTFEFKVAPPAATTKNGEFKFLPLPDTKATERRIVVVEGQDAKTAERRVDVVVEKYPAAGASTLKLSSDGKTAAVVGADGTVTIYDVATGKETMKFPGKK